MEEESWEEVNYGGDDGNDDGNDDGEGNGGGNGGIGIDDEELVEIFNFVVKGVGIVRMEGWVVMGMIIVLLFVGGIFVIVV